MATIGFIGLGIMSAHVTRNLLRGNHTLIANDRHSMPENLRPRATVTASSATVAQAADIVIAMVPDTPEVAKVLFRGDRVAQGLTAGKLFIDISSISPIKTQDFVERAEALGADYLDAPVSDGEVGARDATLTIMVSGKEAAFGRAKPLFTLMGKNITYVGGSGAERTCKVANQIIVVLAIETVGEALLFASETGADPARVRQVLMGGFASSRILEVHGEQMIKRAFDPDFHIELRQKDLSLTLEDIRKFGTALLNTAAAQQLFNIYVANGGKAWGRSAVVHALELMADHTTA